jgi:hypothetical protein
MSIGLSFPVVAWYSTAGIPMLSPGNAGTRPIHDTRFDFLTVR